jgi:DNA-binding NarL/FixJ family response regulator
LRRCCGGGFVTVRVVGADDHATVRAGIMLILDGVAGIKVVGEAGDGEQAVAMARELWPDVAVMHVRMPQLDGISPPGSCRGSVTC